MTLPVTLSGRCTTTSNSNQASITSQGALVVAPYAYNESVFKELGTDDAGFTFYNPVVGRRFILDGFLAYGDKQVASVTNATVVIFEATSKDSSTVSKILFQFEIGQNQSISFSGTNIRAREGFFINAKTDDDDVHMTILGYFVPG